MILNQPGNVVYWNMWKGYGVYLVITDEHLKRYIDCNGKFVGLDNIKYTLAHLTPINLYTDFFQEE